LVGIDLKENRYLSGSLVLFHEKKSFLTPDGVFFGGHIIAQPFITKSTHRVTGNTVAMKPEDREKKSDNGLVRE
jgi:hypothetical protein